MTITDTKTRILHLIGQYTQARVQEELAGFQDKPQAILKRYADRADLAWNEINAEIDRLMAGGEK